MAYKKKSSSKKYYKKRSASSYAGKSLYAFAKALAEPSAGLAVSYMKKTFGLNTEKHWLDTVETNVGTSSTCQAMAYPLTIPQGDSVNSRQGASCRLDSYNVKIRLQANAAATTPCMVRILFVKFRDTRGNTPASTNFLDSASRITSQYNMGDAADSTGYSVLFDRTIPINIYTSDDSVKMINFRFNPIQHHLKWTASDTTGAAAALADGFIRGYIYTSETGANTPNYWADHRVKFVDN